MYTRVVRFTDVSQDRIDGLKQQIEENDGPPEGVVSTGVKFFHDADQQTMIVVQSFDSKENMEASEAALEAMDPGDTPGTRASVDRCQLVVEVHA